MDVYITVQDVAKVLNVSTRTVYNLVKDGKLQGFQFGSNWRVKEADLKEFIRASSVSPEAAQDPPETAPEPEPDSSVG